MRSLAPVIGIIFALLVLPAGIMAQEVGDSAQEYKFSKEELTQMLAPIALYPDALTAQILMASTYPLEVVEAERWRGQNRQLQGAALDAALLDKDWDPSVKSLCHFPDLLNAMSDKLDQTRKLGDAFLGQEEEVMATVQELRDRAREQGSLNTTNEQQVIAEEGNIRIEPANPEVIYVPVYDPYYVYGPWWYPAYPPYYWYYPPGFYGGVSISFGSGIFFGYNAFSWCWFDWPVYRVHVDINRTRSFHRHLDRREGFGEVWRHNPQHRKGVAYRDLRTSDRFGARTPRFATPPGPERRGYPGRRVEPQNLRPSPPPSPRSERQAVPQTPRMRQAPAARTTTPVIRREGTVTLRVPPESGLPPRSVVGETPFLGIGEGSFERRAAERGSLSNRSNVMREPSGSQIQQRQEGGGSRGGRQDGGSRRDR